MKKGYESSWKPPSSGEASMSIADVDMSKTGKTAGKKSEVASLMNKGIAEEGGDYDTPPPSFGPAVMMYRLQDTVASAFVAGGIVLSIACMALNPGVTLVIFPMIITLFTAPYVGYQRSILRKMDGLREIINQIRNDVNNFMVENDKLNKSNDDLEVSVNHLSDLEGQLDGIIASQGENANNFIKSLKENKETLQAIGKQMEGRILQDLISMLFLADRDGDYLIDPEETDMLLLRCDNFPGVTYDADKFKAAMEKKGYGLNAVIDIVDNIFDDTIPDEDKVFKIEPDSHKH